MIFDNIRSVRARIEAAAQKTGRTADQVDLVAVTKKASAAQVAQALRTGLLRHIGESRVQDASRKARALETFADLPKARWRLIGHLQTNKARLAIDVFDTIDSIDSLRLAQTLESALAELDRKMPVLVQVKMTDRETQSGIAPDDLEEFLGALRRCERLQVRGLMAIAPMLDPVERVRPHFESLKKRFDQFFPEGGVLSMGMSRDFEVAVEEGSTMVRIGTALFA